LSERNQLFFGDNLQVLRDSFGHESVNLIYVGRRSTASATSDLHSQRPSSCFVALRAAI
jgi:hypothetical protein